jgi:hypothetical protein
VKYWLKRELFEVPEEELDDLFLQLRIVKGEYRKSNPPNKPPFEIPKTLKIPKIERMMPKSIIQVFGEPEDGE